MTALRVLLSRLLEIVLGRRRERDLGDEIEAHLELLTEEHLRRGLSPEAARAAATRDFGGVESVKEAHRHQRGLPFANALHLDVRIGARLLVKGGWSTAVAAGALALAIAAGVTVFTFVNAAALRGLPVEEPHRIISIYRLDRSGVRGAVSYETLETLRTGARAFEGIAGYRRSASTVTDPDMPPEQIRSLYLSAGAFELLRIAPVLGRSFVPEDDRPGAPPVVILGDSVFRGRYGADPGILGRSIGVNGVETAVIGVMPEDFQFDYFANLWQPLASIPGLTTERRESQELSLLGRLADGVELASARSEVEGIDLRRRPSGGGDHRLVVTPFTGTVLDTPMMPALLGAAAILILIACANVASLLLAGAAQRAREIAIRAAIGATRFRILRQLAVESALLSVLSGIAGLGLAVLGVRLFSGAVEDIPKPYWIRFTMDGPVFLFFAAVCLAATVSFGLAPALHLSKANLRALKAVASVRARRWTNGLLAMELALTLTLLAGAGLLLRSVLTLYQLDKVVDTANLTAMALRLPEAKYAAPYQWTRFIDSLEERLSGSSAIRAATTASTFPFAGASTRELVREGDQENPVTVSYLTVGASYFETLGVATVLGRDFVPADAMEGQEGAIVSRLLAQTFFGGGNPVGHRVGLSEGTTAVSWFTIVGVVPDVRQRLVAGPDPTVYVLSRVDPQPFAMVLVRSAPGTAGAVSAVREEVHALDPELPLYGVTEVDRVRSQSTWPNRVFGAMFAVFASIALALSAVGLYALVARAVSQRVQEIGVRMAFGAEASHIRWLVARGTVFPLSAGLAGGIAGALGVGRLLQSVLVRTNPSDPLTLIAIAGLLLGVSMVACWMPARRAASLDPMTALRSE